jgi:putative ATPase
LYPLAQAALYLAGTEKSNSVLGFFDALKTVRDAQKQDVPGHLRDANRDGAAFGDGVGYRYPHAYAEHWVEQQYLPTPLQGEVFWQPGQLGWEGERRERMAERRAAQLAAAAELAADQPLLLSSGPDRPGVDRWVQRQLGQEGERLQRLRERLWREIPWTRRDRVLLLGVRSLIWALDPLRATPEGGVTVLCENEADRSRLEAQMDLLEPEHRPELLTGNLDALPESQAFDWIGGRLAAADLQGQNWTALLKTINQHAEPTTGLRLLISRAELGPAGALLQDGEPTELLSDLVAQEQQWLELQQRPEKLLAKAGWQLRCEEWLEHLMLPGGTELAERWLIDGSPYRQAMGEISKEVMTQLRQSLNDLGEVGLRLPMRHQLIQGKCSMPSKKTPKPGLK